MRRFRARSDKGGDIDARLRAERPAASRELIDRISGQVVAMPVPRRITRARKGVAIMFASLVLTSAFGAAAFGKPGGNGNGNNGNGNGNSGTPAGCVEGNGKVTTQNTNC